VTVAVDASSLAPGEYYGQIQVTSPDANNSPQSVTVVLDVLATGVDPGPEVRPTGLIFTGAAGTSPSSQNIFISNLTGATTSYSSGRVTKDGANWFVNAPTNDTVPPNNPVKVVVQPDFTSLAPGTYNGVLTLLFDGGVVRTVNILSVVTGSGTTQSSEFSPLAATGTHDAGPCTPKSLNVRFNSPDPTVQLVTTKPVNVRVSGVDDCGTPMQASSIALFFSNSSSLTLQQVGTGTWETSWQPSAPGSVVMRTFAIQPAVNGGIISGDASITVSVKAGGTTPLVQSGVLNAASGVPNDSLPPGGLITVKGSGLADNTEASQGAPYPTTLGGTQLLLDGTPLALLYASDGQINAQAPYDLSGQTDLALNARHQLKVMRSQSASIPVDSSYIPAQPGIFTLDASGSGPAYIYSVRQGVETLAQPSTPAHVDATPAHAGDEIKILCSGLGLVSPTVPLGATPPGPKIPLAVNPVLVMIGDKAATVISATLSAGYPGQYEVRAAVPAGVTGDQVPVVLTVGNQTTPAKSPASATMAIQ
jgi:uncharacterized protein (TIGR03437 family)